jgi:hypothetical protein
MVDVFSSIVAAEEAGIRQIWMAQIHNLPDAPPCIYTLSIIANHYG